MYLFLCEDLSSAGNATFEIKSEKGVHRNRRRGGVFLLFCAVSYSNDHFSCRRLDVHFSPHPNDARSETLGKTPVELLRSTLSVFFSRFVQFPVPPGTAQLSFIYH